LRRMVQPVEGRRRDQEGRRLAAGDFDHLRQTTAKRRRRPGPGGIPCAGTRADCASVTSTGMVPMPEGRRWSRTRPCRACRQCRRDRWW
jgi:hypothetical protein